MKKQFDLHFLKQISAAFLVVISFLGIAPATTSAQTEGLMTVCEPGVYPFFGMGTLFTNPSVRPYGAEPPYNALALDPPCAMQNWAGQLGNNTSYPKAVNAAAAPNVVSISPNPTTVKFTVEGVGVTGPLDGLMPKCFPQSAKDDDGCSGVLMAVFRLANGAGAFTGKWTIATSATNPYFRFLRSGDCPSGLPSLSNPAQGFPCTYSLHFLSAASGAPILTKAMQVEIVSSAGGGGIFVGDGFVAYNSSATFTIPMLFTPGSSVSVTAEAAVGTLVAKKKTKIRGTVVGALIPTALPSLALEAKPAGTTSWVQKAQLKTNGEGVALFDVQPAVTTQFRVKLVSTSSGQAIVSTPVTVTAIRTLSLRSLISKKTVNKKVIVAAALSGKVSPSNGLSKVSLQKFVGGIWTTLKKLSVSGKGAYAVKVTPSKGLNIWRISADGSTKYGASISPLKTYNF